MKITNVVAGVAAVAVATTVLTPGTALAATTPPETAPVSCVKAVTDQPGKDARMCVTMTLQPAVEPRLEPFSVDLQANMTAHLEIHSITLTVVK